jgi:molecular chaperone IbpA
MRYDFSPLSRSTVGFDRLFDLIGNLDQERAPSYPPYNIEARENQLIVSGQIDKSETVEAEAPVAVYRGIAERAFERQFSLADHVKVSNASLVNGLLHIDLAREVPEALKPRQIKINKLADKRKVLEKKAA